MKWNHIAGLSLFALSGATPGWSQSAEEQYLDALEPVVQRKCTVCHTPGGVAENGGARLLLGDDAAENYQLFANFLERPAVDAQLVLQKIVGNAGHGGGPVLTNGSAGYRAFENFLALALGGDTGGGPQPEPDFWAGTVLESRETTLRRAAILLAGKIPGQPMINLAKKSDAGLRGRLIKLMSGPGFKDFLITGANDRLHTDGLNRGVEFNFDALGRFPKHSAQRYDYPEDIPEELYNEYLPKPYLTSGEVENGMRWGMIREPLELIADIVMKNQTYKSILTANHTMVNSFTNIGYRSGTSGLASALEDDDGLFDRRDVNVFKRGTNKGYVFFDDDYRSDEDTWEVLSHSGFRDWPHAGILTTPAWLARYPSTDTNRNRARARWTYYHFLDIDIEKSAPRSTDPDALADTNNPTMNNPACTVCHERMDPVAGAYQSFGDQGAYLDQWGGEDSLADSYKYPEWYGGVAGSSPYVPGDTWYRDMRAPGFDGARASGSKDSLQWLGWRIANDPRFARATVKFWWPAIFGAEALAPPADPNLPNYDQRLRAYNAQSEVIDQLAEKFSKSGYKLKSLLADMVMSPWFRTEAVEDADDAMARSVELATVGSGRLLTPEELDRKHKAVFGRTWGESDYDAAHFYESTSWLRPDHWNSASIFYGGIDSASVNDRNRNMTALMSNVAEKMALDMSCQIVLGEFREPKARRTLFKRVEADIDPRALTSDAVLLNRSHELDQGGRNAATHTVPFSTSGGIVTINIADASPEGCRQVTEEEWTCSHLAVHEVAVLRDGRVFKQVRGTGFERAPNVSVGTWTDEQTGEKFLQGWTDDWQSAFYFHTNASGSVSWQLPAGDYTLQVKLGVILPREHHNDHVTADLRISSDKVDFSTPGAKAVMAQVNDLYLRATNRRLTSQQKRALVETLADYAADEAAQETWFHGHCDTWTLWPNEELTPAEWDAVWGDPTGMKRAWSLAIYQLMTSFWYLHD